MKERAHRLTLGEMETIARGATRKSLVGYHVPESRNFVVGKEITDTHGIFELYIAGKKPADAQVISCATVDRLSGEVSVEVFLDPLQLD